MKKLILISALVLATCATQAQQTIDRYARQSIPFITNVIATSGFLPTTGSNAVVDCRYQGTVAFTYTASSSGTNALPTYMWYALGDGVNYSSTSNSLAFTNSGTSVYTQTGTVSVSGYGYMTIYGLQNTNSGSYVTNPGLAYQIKTRNQ
jgi:hypothetical protein